MGPEPSFAKHCMDSGKTALAPPEMKMSLEKTDISKRKGIL